MDRVAVFVDAGYFFAQSSLELFGEKVPRSEMSLDARAGIAALKAFAASLTNLDLLRIYWYDGTFTGPTQQQINLADLPDVKVRLGSVNPQGQQKGVDSLIVTDMIALAQNRAMATCILLAGDENLSIGVQLAQERGVRVHLLGIKPARGSQSRLLRQEADDAHAWTYSNIVSFLTRKSEPPVVFAQRAVASLENVAEVVAATVPEHEIDKLVRSISETSKRPKDIDGQLLGRSREVIGQHLNTSQKRSVRDHFLKALKTRQSESKT